MAGMHRLNILLVDYNWQVLWDASLRFSLSQMQLFSFVITEAISEIQLHLPGLTCLIPVFSRNNRIRNILGNQVFEELVELGAFFFIVVGLLKD